jgi:D-aminoacyl-tRNA deacylase
MIGLLQRVTEASVSVDGKVVASITAGLLVLAAVQPDDTEATVKRLAERIVGYRLFPDKAGKMNLSLADTGFGLLLVPQFTLAADTRKGMRASFTGAASPELGRRYFALLFKICSEMLPGVQSGVFGADMKVALINDGPVTFWIDS